jgi:predicted DNA-binding WGR domain protein
MATKKSKSMTESASAVIAGSWRIPAVATQLHRMNQSNLGRSPDLVEHQLVGFRGTAGIDLFKVDFATSHRPSGDQLDRVDMLVATSLDGTNVKTLTYWTDFDSELILPRGKDGGKCFSGDLMSPEIVVIGGDAEISASAAASAGISSFAKHNWPPLTKIQEETIVRMEATEGEWKFWSIWYSNSKVYYHHGRIGEPGGTEGSYIGVSVKSGGGVEEFVRRKIAEKSRKGYVRV